ncbi:MAG TPA: hypothetical protein VG733_12740 [Chthoniobacteraceae bacterium]|nr:hypothetical protein [Chthoniobacteraceae bacterium]
MSWDLVILDYPPEVKTVDDIQGDARPLGTREELISRIRQYLPDAEFRGKQYGTFVRGDYVIEFNLHSDEICGSIGLRVCGSGRVVPVIDGLLKHLGLRAFDCQTGEFFAPESAQHSFSQWAAYRDRAVSQYSPKHDEQ